MDETAWALALLCKDHSDEEPGNPLPDYRDDNHNYETLHQHITDISNSIMEDGIVQYNNSNSSNSNLSINNNNNNITNDNYNSTMNSKVYQRLGMPNELPLRGCHVIGDGEDYCMDLDQSYGHGLSVIHHYGAGGNNHHHHNSQHHPPHCSNNNLVISSSDPHHDQMTTPHHHYTNGDHNHYHMHHNHLLNHRLEYGDVGSSVSHFNGGNDTSSSNSSPVSLTSAQHNNNHRHPTSSSRHHMNSYMLRRNMNPPSIVRSTNGYDTYATHQSSVSYNNTDHDESSTDSESKKPVIIKQEEGTSYPARRRPGRPRGSRRKKPEKLGRLWEFIRDLLLSPESCPSLICWDNYEEGMFRFVRSDKVAKLWGEKRDNPEMNYEKLSRAMRYYYKSNVLQPVFGRRLVYKFGPEARGWKTENPNFTC